MSNASAPAPEGPATPTSFDGRLDSWKEIAAYLKRDIRTVQRWEKLEGLPVRRHQHQKRGSAFAYRDELDTWWQSRGHEVDAAPAVDVSNMPPAGNPPASSRGRWRIFHALPWVISCGALAVAAVSFEARGTLPRTRATVERFVLLPPAEHSLTPARGLAMSPDGKRLSFVSYDQAGIPSLWLREIGQLDARRLPGTEGASWPFWAADGSALAFFANGKLKRTDLTGALPRTVCDAPNGRGGTWRGDVILFAPYISGPLFRVSASGSAPQAATAIDKTRQETAHRWPQFLPDGRHFIFFVHSAREDVRGSYLGDLSASTHTLVSKSDSVGLFASGHLLFPREGGLAAQPLDVEHGRLQGNVLQLGDRASYERTYGVTNFSVSESGALVYLAGNWKRNQLAWYDEVGRDLGSASAPMPSVSSVALSPDGRLVAIQRWDPDGQAHAIWIGDLSRGGWSRLTFSKRGEMWPVWSPDARRIAFSSSHESGFPAIYQKVVDVAGSEGVLIRQPTVLTPTDWSSDGKYLLFHGVTDGQNRHISAFPISNSGETISLRESPFDQGSARLSPDQKWLVYESNESGVHEVYVDAFPSQGLRRQVSTTGGYQPRWRHDGKELFFVTPDRRLMAVSFEGAGAPHLGIPHVLFELPIENPTLGFSSSTYDVAPSGRRFLVSRSLQTAPESLTVVMDWQAAAQH